MFIRLAHFVLFVLVSVLACGQRGDEVASWGASSAELTAAPPGAGSLGSYEPAPRGALVDVDVDPSQGSLQVGIGLPTLPTRASFGPQIRLAWSTPGTDAGQGFGVGFGLDVPSIQLSSDWGSPLPGVFPNGDITARLSLHGQRLVHVATEEVLGQERLEYRLEGSESDVRVFRWRSPDLRVTTVPLTWPDRSKRNVIGPGGLPQPFAFQGFQVAYPDGQQEIYTEEPAMAEGQYVGGDFFPVRWPLRYAVSAAGDVITYEHEVADDARSYLKRVTFAGGRSEYAFDVAERTDGPVGYSHGFRQGAKYLYTRMQARFDGARTDEWCFVYRTVGASSRRLLTHPDCVDVAESELGADLLASSDGLSRQDRLLGILRFGTSPTPFAKTASGEPTIRFRATQWSRSRLSSHQLTYDLAVPDVAGFGPEGGSEFLDLNGDGLLDIARWRADTMATEALINEGDLERKELLSRGPDVHITSIQDGTEVTRPLHFDSNDSADSALLAGDFDGDGNSDVIAVRRISSAADEVGLTLYRGPIDGSGRYRAVGSEGRVSGRFRDFVAYRTRVVDVNGDGKDDLLQAPFADGRSSWTVLVNIMASGSTEPQFQSLANLTFPFDGGPQWELNHPAYRFVDINEDGLADLAVVRQDADATGLCVYENHGTVRAAPGIMAWLGDDVNADGQAEELLLGEQGKADGICGQGYYLPIAGIEPAQNINAFWMVDADGDGGVDLATVDSATGRELLVWLGRGREGFEAPFRLSLGDGISLSVDPNNPWNTRVADVDGDGWEEIAVFNPGADSRRMRVVDFNRNGANNWIGPDILVGVDEGAGIRHGFQYSSVIDEAIRDRRGAGRGALETPGTPYPQVLVKRHVREVAWLPATVREYQYHGPVFDGLYREFLGFERAEVFSHGDSSQPSLGTFYTFGGAREVACGQAGPQPARDVCLRFVADKPLLRQDATLSLTAEQSERVTRIWSAGIDSPEAASEGRWAWGESPLAVHAVLSSETNDWRVVPINGAETLPVFIRNERSEFRTCGPESCENPARVASEYAYDGPTNRLAEEVVTRSEVVFSDPGVPVRIPARTLRRTVTYDPAWTARGVSGAVAGEFVRSERSGRTLSSSAVSYAEDAPLPSVSARSVLTDRAGLPSEVAQLFPEEQERKRVFEYDQFGNLILERDGRSVIVRRVFDSTGVRITETANALGHAVRTCYGSDGCPLPTPPDARVSARSVDPTHVQSPQGETIVSEYDDRHRVTRMMSSAGGEVRLRYSEGDERSAQRVVVEERSGFVGGADSWIRRLFAFAPDGTALGAAVEEDRTSSRVLRREAHNRFGQVAYSAEPYATSGALESLWSAPADMPIPICAQGTGDCFSYDALGRISERLASSGAERATVRHFGWGQRLETELLDGDSWTKRVRQRVADDSEVYALVDELGIAWRFDYDERGALIEVQPPGRPARAVRRNSAGEIVYADVPLGMRRAWKRDDRGRVAEARTWNWDLSQSESLVHAYDDLDRVVGTVASSSGHESVENRTTFSYDQSESGPTDPNSVGRLVSATARDEVTRMEVAETYAYDARGRTLRQTLACDIAGMRRSYAEEFGYSLDGAVSSYHDPFDNGFAVAHNRWGAPASVVWTSARGETKSLFSEVQYNGRGQVASFQQALGAGVITRERSYEPPTGRLSGQAACAGPSSCAGVADAFQKRTYVRRPDGLVISEGATNLPPDRVYSYSDRGELVTAQFGEQAFAYSYHDAGQMRLLDEGTARSFSSTSSSAVLPLPEGYAADSFGRVTATPTIRSVEYDAWSRPRHVALRDGRSIDYAYDSSGRRMAKVVSSEATQSLVVYPTPSARDDGVQRQSLVSFGEHAVGLMVDEQTVFALLDDQRGVSEGVLSEDGHLSDAWSTTPYGRINRNGDAAPLGLQSSELVLRFAGQVRDEDTGTVLMGSRDYFPELGSFGVPDPYFLESPEQCAGSVLECDLYAYVGHDPVNEIDETGLARVRADKRAALLRKTQSFSKYLRKQAGRPLRHVVNTLRGRALDRAFGAAKPPGGMGVKAFERAADGTVIRNPELQTLASGTKAQLEAGREYIWAIDEGGTMLIGEEVPTGVVEPNGYVQKLGHPTLTQGGLGRIAGELRFENGGWLMNNDSGRYSGHADRTARQLENARRLLEKRGITNVTTSFNPRRLPPR